MYEIYNEVIRDLLDPDYQGGVCELGANAQDGVHVQVICPIFGVLNANAETLPLSLSYHKYKKIKGILLDTLGQRSDITLRGSRASCQLRSK